MSHSKTSSFDYHLDNSFAIFNDVHFGITLRRMRVAGHVSSLDALDQSQNGSLCYFFLDVVQFSVVLLLSLEASILLRSPEAAIESFLLV